MWWLSELCVDHLCGGIGCSGLSLLHGPLCLFKGDVGANLVSAWRLKIAMKLLCSVLIKRRIVPVPVLPGVADANHMVIDLHLSRILKSKRSLLDSSSSGVRCS